MKTFFVLLTTVLLSTGALADKTAGESVDDTWLHTKVKTALVGHGGSDINIEVYHGHVQLAGFITDKTSKEAAITNARNVKGVKKVLDQIYLVERDRSAGQVLDDNTLTTKVKASLTDSDFGRGFNINVEVNRGIVLLSGFVENDDEREAAVDVAKAVNGTKKVINGINLVPKAG